jgi:hypothetical protein
VKMVHDWLFRSLRFGLPTRSFSAQTNLIIYTLLF